MARDIRHFPLPAQLSALLTVTYAVLAVGCGQRPPAAHAKPALALTNDSRLVLFSPYRTAQDFESLGLAGNVAEALSRRSEVQEVWHAALLVGDRVVTAVEVAAPSSAGQVPPVVVVSARPSKSGSDGP
jgi:hypothetical protein